MTPPAVLEEVSIVLVASEGFCPFCGKHAEVETSRNGEVLPDRFKAVAAHTGPVDVANKVVVDAKAPVSSHLVVGRVIGPEDRRRSLQICGRC